MPSALSFLYLWGFKITLQTSQWCFTACWQCHLLQTSGAALEGSGLQAFPNTVPGRHKKCSHLGFGGVCPLPQLAQQCPQAALWGRAGVCPHWGFYGWLRALAEHLLSDLLLPHLRRVLPHQEPVCLFRKGDYNIYFPAEMQSLVNRYLSN